MEVILALQAAALAYQLLHQIITDLEAQSFQFTPAQRASITEARHKAVEAIVLQSQALGAITKAKDV